MLNYLQVKTNLLLLLIIPALGFAQVKFPVDSATGRICYTSIIQVDSADKDELMRRAEEWLALHDNIAPEIKLDDRVRGKIIVKGRFTENIYFENSIAPSFPITVYYSILMEFKDGKCRVKINDFSFITQSLIGKQEQTFENGLADLETGYGDKKRFAVYKQGWYDFFSTCDRDINESIKSLSKLLQQKQNGETDNW